MQDLKKNNKQMEKDNSNQDSNPINSVNNIMDVLENIGKKPISSENNKLNQNMLTFFSGIKEYVSTVGNEVMKKTQNGEIDIFEEGLKIRSDPKFSKCMENKSTDNTSLGTQLLTDLSSIYSNSLKKRECTYKPKEVELSSTKCYLHLLPSDLIDILIRIALLSSPQIIWIYYGNKNKIKELINIERSHIILLEICRKGYINVLEENLDLGFDIGREYQYLLDSGKQEAIDWLLNYIDDLSTVIISGNLSQEQILELFSVGAKVSSYSYDTAIKYNKIENIDFLLKLDKKTSTWNFDPLVGLDSNATVSRLAGAQSWNFALGDIIDSAIHWCNYDVFKHFEIILNNNSYIAPKMTYNKLTLMSRITNDFHKFINDIEEISDESTIGIGCPDKIFSNIEVNLFGDLIKLGYTPAHNLLHRFDRSFSINFVKSLNLSYQQCCVDELSKLDFDTICEQNYLNLNTYLPDYDDVYSILEYLIEAGLDIRKPIFYTLTDEITKLLLKTWIPDSSDFLKIIKLSVNIENADEILKPLIEKMTVTLEMLQASEENEHLLNRLLTHTDNYIMTLYLET